MDSKGAAPDLLPDDSPFRLAFEHARTALLVVGLDGRILYSNASAVAVFGYAPQELTGKRVHDLALPGEPVVAPAEIAALIEGRTDRIALRRRYRRKDGQTVWGLGSTTLARDAHGIPRYLVTDIEDVTERYEAEERLRVSEQRHRLIAENALDVIWTMRPDGSVSYVSPSVAQLRGLTVAEAMAQTLDEIHPPASAAASMRYFGQMTADIAAGRQPASFRGELEYRRKDGSTVWTDVMAYPILDHDGRLVELLGVSRDLDERKRHEAALIAARDATETANRALQRAIVELAEAQRLAHVGSWTLDAATGALAWSDELYRIFGQELGSPIPTFAAAAAHYDDAALQQRDAIYARTLASGEPWALEYDLAARDGPTRRVRARGEAVRDADGAVIGLRGTITDLTELREAQSRLEQAQRLELVGRLAGGVAHQFNNLNLAILLSAEFLATAIPAEDTAQQYVEAIHTAATKASALTAHLLAFGRRQMLRPEVVALDDVVDGMLPMLQSLVSETADVVASHSPEQALVRADRSRLEGALGALILNARDAMPDGGLISISTGPEVIPAGDPRLLQEHLPGEYARLSVTDTGLGIAPEVLPHVFEPFFTTKEFGQAQGLGLASVEGCVAQSGGFVTVVSTVGVGSTFSVFLPRLAGDDGDAGEQPSA